MAHKIRTVLDGYHVVEITNRTFHGRLLLRPSKEINRMILGALGRAQRKYGVDIFGFVFLSNHYHLLAGFRDAHQMARFVGYFQSKIAKEVRRRYGWKDKLWARRFTDVPVNPSDEDQVARLRYLFENSCKEGLVASPVEWPGVHCAKLLAAGDWQAEGEWFDRTEEWKSRHRGESVRPGTRGKREVVRLSPLPCWKHLSAEGYRKAIVSMLEDVERRTKEMHRARRTRPLGRRRILDQSPRREPTTVARSIRPKVHALTSTAFRVFQDAYAAFLMAYRAAADRLKKGDLAAVFPVGCFPPGLPFVPL